MTDAHDDAHAFAEQQVEAVQVAVAAEAVEVVEPASQEDAIVPVEAADAIVAVEAIEVTEPPVPAPATVVAPIEPSVTDGTPSLLT